MRRINRERAEISSMFGIFFLIMMAVFSAEVSVMQFYEELLDRITVVQGAFLDASILVLAIALPLWFFVFRPSFREKIKKDGGYIAVAFSLYVKILAGLYLIQLGIMLLLPHLTAYIPPSMENLTDGVLTVIFSGPLFWWLLYRLELHYRLEPLADFLNDPYTLYVLLLFMIFLADLMQEMLLPQFEAGTAGSEDVLLDAVFTVLMIAPLLLILVVRPLRRMARSEKTRTDAIYDQVVDGIVKVDKQGIVQAFNLAARKIFGFSPAEIVGRPASVLLNRGELDLTAEVRQLEAEDGERLLFYKDLNASHKDGEPLVLDVTLRKIELEGTEEFLVFFRDISERKAAEEALLATDAIFREIFNQTEDAILFFEPSSMTILDVNAATELLYGYTKKEILDGGLKLFADNKAERRMKKFLSEIGRSGSAQVDRIENRCADGRKLIVSLHGKIMSLRGSRVIYCTVRDITKRVRMEDEARSIQSKLIQTNKMTSLGLLVSGVAHEINNPNNYVMTNAQILSGIWKDASLILDKYYQEHGDFLIGGIPFSELESEAPDIFNSITEGSRRINAIVNDLKRFVRQDTAGKRVDIDVNSTVSAAVSMLHYELAKYTDDFKIHLADDLPQVQGSSQQLGQVIINLLMNACQALGDRSSGVSLTTYHDLENDQVHILIRDQGCGLPEETREKILDPFFTTKMDSGGTGLGLSISQSIIKEHGGEIDFFNNTDKGTTFVVKLPITRDLYPVETELM